VLTAAPAIACRIDLRSGWLLLSHIGAVPEEFSSHAPYYGHWPRRRGGCLHRLLTLASVPDRQQAES
jgi:hypothetical protein